MAGLASCVSLKQPSAVLPELPNAQPSRPTTGQPAQAQTATAEPLPTDFHAAEALKPVEVEKSRQPEALASTDRKIVSQTLRKPLGLSKVVLKIAEKQLTKSLKKRRPAQQDGTILGLRPILFFALVAVLAGVILLFVAGKSQFFSILTVTLLIGGLLVSLAAFLDII